MLTLKSKKMTSLLLASFMSVSILGTAIAEAHPDCPPPAPRHEHWQRNHPQAPDNGHSTGEVTTAAIIGAVVGAVIAKNT